jgi:hypothetical protein
MRWRITVERKSSGRDKVKIWREYVAHFRPLTLFKLINVETQFKIKEAQGLGVDLTDIIDISRVDEPDNVTSGTGGDIDQFLERLREFLNALRRIECGSSVFELHNSTLDRPRRMVGDEVQNLLQKLEDAAGPAVFDFEPLSAQDFEKVVELVKQYGRIDEKQA